MPDESYCVSLPWPVFTDKRLSATAKLLYGEIYSLAQKSGYCYAKNEHFQEVLGITDREVRYCLGELCGNIRKGKQRMQIQGEEYIRIQFEGPRNERKIYPVLEKLLPGTPVPPPHPRRTRTTRGRQPHFCGGRYTIRFP